MKNLKGFTDQGADPEAEARSGNCACVLQSTLRQKRSSGVGRFLRKLSRLAHAKHCRSQ